VEFKIDQAQHYHDTNPRSTVLTLSQIGVMI